MQSTLDGLASWMTHQPWYAGSPDGIPRLRELVELFLPATESGTRVRVLLVRDESPDTPVLYQLPLVERDRPTADGRAPIGVGYGGVPLYDGASDPAFAGALLGALRDRGELRDLADDRYVTGTELVSDGATAIVRIAVYGRPTIEARIARRVLDGDDPEVVAAIALADAGDPETPRLVGVMPVEWTDDETPHTAHLAVLREAAGAAADGWSHVLRLARRNVDPADDLRRLGAAIARAHLALTALGTRPAGPADIGGTVAAWRTRLAGAVREIPALAEREADLGTVHDGAAALVPWPQLQAIHGALELGVARRCPDGSWFLTGHGGGDTRPVDERADLPVRDVAGALRSIHYAGALAGASADWIDRARLALLDGYTDVAGDDALPAALLDALELDYAVLDAVWESRVRPDALRVPLAGIDRVIAAGLDEPRAATAA